jgi:hypothetical protein
LALAQRDDTTKVKVMRQDNALFNTCFSNDIVIIESLQTLVAKVDGIMSLGS